MEQKECANNLSPVSLVGTVPFLSRWLELTRIHILNIIRLIPLNTDYMIKV